MEFIKYAFILVVFIVAWKLGQITIHLLEILIKRLIEFNITLKLMKKSNPGYVKKYKMCFFFERDIYKKWNDNLSQGMTMENAYNLSIK